MFSVPIKNWWSWERIRAKREWDTQKQKTFSAVSVYLCRALEFVDTCNGRGWFVLNKHRLNAAILIVCVPVYTFDGNLLNQLFVWLFAHVNTDTYTEILAHSCDAFPTGIRSASNGAYRNDSESLPCCDICYCYTLIIHIQITNEL